MENVIDVLIVIGIGSILVGCVSLGIAAILTILS